MPNSARDFLLALHSGLIRSKVQEGTIVRDGNWVGHVQGKLPTHYLRYRFGPKVLP